MKLKKKLLLFIIVLFGIILLNPLVSKAALQANGKSTKTDSLPNWMTNIRYMESSGGTLGLTDTINGTNLTSSANKSNNLDIHMEKNSEYGAMAILSASAYGNKNKINNGDTTTGNKTGVVMTIGGERVVAGQLTSCAVFTNANPKYKDVYYKNNYIAKRGDALSETYGWHGANGYEWLYDEGGAALLRGHSGSIFSYYAKAKWWASIGYEDGHFSKPFGTRAVIVVGEGI